MRRFLTLFAAFFAAVLLIHSTMCVAAESESDEDDGDVVVLTNDNFESFIKDNPVVLVEFYAPWCGHCKRLAPEYKKAATELKGKVPLGKVDATVEKELGQQFEVRGYPTIKLFRNGKPEEYGGGRTGDLIVEWITRMTGPSFLEVENLDKAKKYHEETNVLYVAHVKDNTTDKFKTFVEVADSNRQLGRFFVVVGDDAKDEIIVFRKSEDPIKKSLDSLKAEIDDFVKNEYFPLFGPITAETYGAYAKRDLEFVWYAAAEDDYNEAMKVMQELAKSYRDKYSFVWLDTTVFGAHAQNALAIDEFPGLVIQSKKGRFIYPEKKIKKASLLQFFDDVSKGKLKPKIKSEPVPEKQEGPVKVIVGDTMKAEIMDSGKDVMLEVYAPWCGHCQKLTPIYEELAESAKAFDHLVIAKMDGVENESPIEDFEWSGFPTIFYKKAGSDKPMTFDGSRTLEGLQKYIEKHSSKTVKFTKKKDEAKSEEKEKEEKKEKKETEEKEKDKKEKEKDEL